VTTSEILRRDRQRKEAKREEREERAWRRGLVILRPKEIWKRLGCGRTKFYEHYVANGLVKLMDIGPNMKGAPEYEIDAIIEEFIAKRDAKLIANNDGKEKQRSGAGTRTAAENDSAARRHTLNPTKAKSSGARRVE
jgi:predicted DNA-binding transcriptional regulator AlpA